MRYHSTYLLILSSFCVALVRSTSEIPSISSQTPSPLISQSDQPPIPSTTPCSPIIESQFIKIDYSCINGCVVLSDQQRITLPSLVLSDIPNVITTCISFNNIQKVEIDTVILSNLRVQINHPQSYLIQFSNIDSLTISKLNVTNLAQPDSPIDEIAFYIDSSVLALTLYSAYFSSINRSNPNEQLQNKSYPFNFLLSSKAQTTSVSTLFLSDCYDQITFSTISTIEFDKIIYEQPLLVELPNYNLQTTLELRAQISIRVNSIEILDKRDSYRQIITDLVFTALIKNEFQTQISIGSIIRNTQSIESQLIQSAQNPFRIQFYKVSFSGQTLSMNLEIQSISVSMNSMNSGSQKGSKAMVLLEIQQFNIVSIQSIFLSEYSQQLIHFFTTDQISIGQLEVTGTSNLQNNSYMINEYLIQNQRSTSITFDRIVVQNVAFNSITYLTFGSVQSLTIKYLLIQNMVFISSQLISVAESTSIRIFSTQIIDSILRISVSKEYQDPIFSITNSQSVEFNEFVMKSPNLNINWIESFQSNPLSQSQSVILSNNCSSHTFSEIHVDFEGLQLGFFSSLNFSKTIDLSNSTFNHCFASLGGGCFQFNLEGNKMMKYEPQIYLNNVTFTHASSGYFGGAIFGSEIISAIDVRFQSCSSLIGGALFLKGTSNTEALTNITFVDNVADIVNSNYCLGIDQVKKGQVKEYNPNLQGTPLFLNPIGQYSDSMEFYAGILYVYELEFFIDGSWYSNIPRERTVQNQNSPDLFINGNLFPFVTEESLLYSQIITNETNFFILYDPTYQSQNDESNTVIGFTFTKYNLNYIYLDDVSNSKCKEGMETIMFSNGYSHICEYCGLSRAMYPTSRMCQTCDAAYFKMCYSNQTELNKGFWRSNYTINTTLIETCSISMSSCNGGFGIGDNLCYEGHIGPQCLNCDIRGEYWGQTYSMSSVFTCNKCSDIESNEIKIILGLVLILLSLLVIIKGNFKTTKNQIFADYLAKIKMIYIGSSLSRQQQTSTCLKVLLFNLFFSNLINSFTNLRVWKSLSETSVILNEPLTTQFFSFDCFLVNTFSSDLNLGFANLVISIATPGVILTAHLIIGFIMLLVKIFKKKKLEIRAMVSTFFLSFAYLFLIVFYPFIFQLCLKSFYCIRLESTRTFSQIDLSLECDNSSNNNLKDIHALATPVLCLIIILMPLAIILFLYSKKLKLRTVNMMLSLGFIYREYKSQFFLWEFVRIILKSVCVFTQVALIGNPQLYGTIIALLLIFYLVQLHSKQPFQGKLFNQLEKVSVSIQILSILSAVLYQQYELNQIRNGTTIKIIFIGSQILNLIFVASLTLLIIISFSQKQLIKLNRKWRIPFAERFLPLYSNQLRNNFKRLRNLVFKFKGRVHSVKVDDLQNLLFSERSQISPAGLEQGEEKGHLEMSNSVYKDSEFDSELINPEKLLINI